MVGNRRLRVGFKRKRVVERDFERWWVTRDRERWQITGVTEVVGKRRMRSDR